MPSRGRHYHSVGSAAHGRRMTPRHTGEWTHEHSPGHRIGPEGASNGAEGGEVRMGERGYACIALDNPKSDPNVGGALRAAQVYGASLFVIGRGRFQRQPTDAMHGYRHLPVLRVDDVFNAIPFDCVPIAIELIEGAQPLPMFSHPERAFYVFGAEDATLGVRILGRCKATVYVPTARCMNLAACVNVVLYDRATKRGEWPTFHGYHGAEEGREEAPRPSRAIPRTGAVRLLTGGATKLRY